MTTQPIIQKTQEQLRQEIAGFCAASNQSKVAESIGISRAYMSDILLGKRTISKKVAQFFGYTVETTPPTRVYRKIETNGEINLSV